jgi:hypothetical protein
MVILTTFARVRVEESLRCMAIFASRYEYMGPLENPIALPIQRDAEAAG